jgi:hypothetical protein
VAFSVGKAGNSADNFADQADRLPWWMPENMVLNFQSAIQVQKFMGMTSSIGRTLFAQMPPSIVINEPLPRWKAFVLRGLKLTGVALVCATWFYAGIHYEQYRQKTGASAKASSPSTGNADSSSLLSPPERGAAAAPALPDLMETRKVEGLDIQALEIVRDSTVPGQLRYQFAVSNEGRLYEGTLEFLIQGTVDGRETVAVQPAAGQRVDGKFQMRVGRYVRTEGTIQVPAGMIPKAVAIRLREPSGNVRASRGVILALPAQGKRADLSVPAIGHS